MRIDCFSFNGELDLLELRLNILDKVVDQFIICESTQTFTGLPKPLYFLENKERYTKWLPKIKHFIMASEDFILDRDSDNSPGVPHNLDWWRREYTQKESMRYALTHLQDDDMIFIGDADEIWNPDNFPLSGRWKLEQLVYAYYLNNRSSEWWEGTSVMPYGLIRKYTLDDLRAHDHHKRPIEKAPTYKDCGWHFTNMGGIEFIKRKMNSYSHQEINTNENQNLLERRMAENKDFIGRDFKMWLDESEWPQYLKDNREGYRYWLAQKGVFGMLFIDDEKKPKFIVEKPLLRKK